MTIAKERFDTKEHLRLVIQLTSDKVLKAYTNIHFEYKIKHSWF